MDRPAEPEYQLRAVLGKISVRKEFVNFPIEARALLPHAGPMCCIDRLLASSKTGATAEATLVPGHSLLRGDALDGAGYVELAAQTAGAMQGYDLYVQNLPPKPGFLVGVQDFCIHDEALVGDTLCITVALTAELAEVSVLSASVFRGGSLLADGRLKVFVPE
jgi:predicted hotdog family 3-hydroxylacyl-ACP dehydratase